MDLKKIWEIPTKRIDPPYQRSLQVVMTPQIDKNIGNFTFLISTIYPHSGQTEFHTHPVDELIYVISGRGESITEGESPTPVEPDTVVYARAGVRHQIKNYSNETMKMACFYIPALPNEVVDKLMEEAK